MTELAACELQAMVSQAIDGDADPLLKYAGALEGALADDDPRGRTRRPIGELWPGTIFEAGGGEFYLVGRDRGDTVLGAKIEGSAFGQGVSFPKSCPVTVVDDSRAVERLFWERGD